MSQVENKSTLTKLVQNLPDDLRSSEVVRAFLSDPLPTVAHHEAGHLVVAAVKGLPLQRKGVKIDSCGRGLSQYEGGQCCDDADMNWYNHFSERAIVSLCAGLIAQKRFFDGDWNKYAAQDRRDIECHLRGLWRHEDSDEAKALLVKCRCEAENIVDQRWCAIKEIAETIWNQDWTKRKATHGWSDLQKRVEWNMVHKILQKWGIVVHWSGPEET